MKLYDAVVIGGGPAGLTAALYLCRSGVSVALVEMIAPGGQVLRTSDIANYPGFPKGIAGWELADIFAAHLEGFTLDRYTETVTGIEHAPGANRLHVGSEWITARTVVICSGASPQPLGLEDEERLVGKGVSYCALCDGNFFRNQVVGVVGGGNSALEEALYLSRIVKKLYLIHRREGFRAAKVLLDKLLQTPNIELLTSTVVTSLEGTQGLTGLNVQNVNTRVESRLAVEGLFVFVGYVPHNEFLPAWLDKDEQGFVRTDCEMRTNLPGVFAAGDIRSKLCRQVTTAVGDGATAATAAFSYLEQLDG